MEDVGHSNMRSRWAWCLLITLCVAQPTLHAASQGKLSASTSRGSIGISLVIPEYTRLVAQMRTTSSIQERKVCMHVINSTDLSTSNYYRVAGLTNRNSDNYKEALDELDEITQVVKLDNHTQANTPIESLCDYQNELIARIKEKHNQTMLLMLISE